MYSDLKFFINNLIKDTKDGHIQWQSVGESWSNTWLSVEHRPINPSLEKWSSNDPWNFNRWEDIYFAIVMDGLIYIAKKANIPPVYMLYIQVNFDARITQIGIPSSEAKKVFEVIQNSVLTARDDVSFFVERYNTLHFKGIDDLDTEE